MDQEINLEIIFVRDFYSRGGSNLGNKISFVATNSDGDELEGDSYLGKGGEWDGRALLSYPGANCSIAELKIIIRQYLKNYPEIKIQVGSSFCGQSTEMGYKIKDFLKTIAIEQAA